jgi:threonine aldolase
MKGFGSDNHAGVHPALLNAIVLANINHAPSYGSDELSESALLKFREHFGSDSQTFFVFNGTAANVCALGAILKPWQSVICSDIAHLNNDECGAPEVHGSFKLHPLPSIHGKITAQQILDSLIRRGDQHTVQAKAISITQPTELGTTYSLAELEEIGRVAKQHSLYLHIDGARYSNAAVSLKSTFAQMAQTASADVISFGGTKNGFMMGEAVVFLKPQLATDFKYLRKQKMQLPSKTRFISAQFNVYLEGLWQEIASHVNKQAKDLAERLTEIEEVKITHPVQSNAVFAIIPKNWIKELRKSHFFYVWDEKTFECRLMMSWDTNENDLSSFISAIKSLQQKDVHR